MSGVLVLAEHRQGALRDVTLEMLAAGRSLARESGTETAVVLLGHGCDEMAAALARQANRVIYAADPAFREFNSEVYQRLLVQLIRARQPDVVLLAHSAFGTDLAPSLAAELGAGLVSDGIGFRKVEPGLVVTRGSYGGKLQADWIVETRPALVMVRQSHFKPEPVELEGQVEVWAAGDVGSGLRTRFMGLEELPTTGIDITKAEVVVGIGRGVKEEKNLGPIKELVAALGGVLAGSRPVVDAGWLPKDCQVGSSGKTVKPKLYIALGISGAFQHVAGMKGADTIIAVNKDPNAPIFSVAQFGVVDDLHKVVPVLLERLKEMKS